LVRKIEIETCSPRFAEIGRLHREMSRTIGKPFFYSSRIRRKYSRRELDDASLLHLKITAVFEPEGEDCGTQYDESSACPQCGSGARQVGDLLMQIGRIPKRKDFAVTIAGEILVSRKAADLLAQHGVTGAEFRAVRSSRSGVESPDWVQLVGTSTMADISPPTRVGGGPFNDDPNGEYRCPRGDLAGFNLLSELSVSAASTGDADIVFTRQFVGARRGVLRPARAILVSQKVRRLIESENLKGCRIEVAHRV
jgi:hypothetical protein